MQPHEWVPPPVVDEYRLLRPLGSGGMGQVFLGHDALLDRQVAVKFISAAQADDRKRQRFLNEGRAVARLSHPNVVAIYRVGEVEGRPYLVSEYVRGRSLAEVPRPLEPERALRIGVGLARGLAAAHRQGILHRDLKPANAMLADDGEVKLLDFGLAKFLATLEGDEPASGTAGDASDPPRSDLTRAGGVLGTPPYMAPEALRGEQASRRSDVFSLGALLFELCTGVPPRASRDTGETYAQHADRPLARISGRAGMPPGFAEAIDRCLEPDPAARFASADELLLALEALLPERAARPLPEGNPYRGLRHFEAEHRALFFGRDADIRGVLDRLRSEPIVLVAGDSGVGKSSLCRAGVLPLVAEGELEPGGARWSQISLVPGRRPIAALCAALAPTLETPEEALDAWLRADPAALARSLRQRRQRGVSTLLFIDQLEELFTLSEPADAALVAEALGHLAAPSAGVRLLATVRGDFFTRLAALPGLGPEVSRALYLLRPLTPEQTRATVVEPARAKGGRFESDELVTSLVDSAAAASGGLPLLQFALAELWDARDRSANTIRAADLQRIGGVSGALARHADGVLAALLPEQRTAARRVLLRLVTAEGTRARRTAEELSATEGPAREALEALVHGRLLVAREVDGATSYEVAHEALISGWATLREWLDVDGDRRLIRARIEIAAAEWERLGRSTEPLWHQTQLNEAARVDDINLSVRERAFLEASARQIKRHTVRQRTLMVAAPLLVALAIGGARLKSTLDLNNQVQTHLAEAEQLAVPARTLVKMAEGKRSRAIELYEVPLEKAASLELNGRSTWKQAEQVWAGAIDAAAQANELLGRANRRIEVAFSLAPSNDRVISSLREVRAEQTRLDTILHRQQPGSSTPSGSQSSGASLSLGTVPDGAAVTLQRYENDGGRLRLSQPIALGATPLNDIKAPVGSLLLTISSPGRPMLRYPVFAQSDSPIRLNLVIPTLASVPDGFVVIPEGDFIFGSNDDEALRSGFGAPPAHTVHLKQYLIGKHEVTFEEWVHFLEAISPMERELHRPSISSKHGAVDLRRTSDGSWHLLLKPAGVEHEAAWSQPIVFKRRAHSVQDWRRFPVSGISYDDGVAYAAWLAKTGRVPGARLCTEKEWSKAARGADDRAYATGNLLDIDDANIDETYGRTPDGYGPEEVGSRPESASPFGVEEMQGNAQEIVQSAEPGNPVISLGGAWYSTKLTARLSNRPPLEGSTRSVYVGLRICLSRENDEHEPK